MCSWSSFVCALATATTLRAVTSVCNKGYQGNGKQCTDVDECTTGVCSDNADCINTDGSYECGCSIGYSGDGTICEDIDECETTASVTQTPNARILSAVTLATAENTLAMEKYARMKTSARVM